MPRLSYASMRLDTEMYKIFLPLLSILFLLAFGIRHQDIELLGKRCRGSDKCGSMSPNAKLDFHKRNCECDNNCLTYGDCCVDAATPRRFSNSILKCVDFGRRPYTGAYMVVGCYPGADPEMKQKCEAGMDLDDPFVSVPVTDNNGNGPTYPNAYCAICNNASLERLVRWDLLVQCNDLEIYDVSSDYIWQNLKRDPEWMGPLRGWSVEYESNEYDAKFIFEPPSNVLGVRLCRRGEGDTEASGLVFGSELVSECPENYQPRGHREACASYTAVVYHNENAYRNPHCAVCNGIALNALVCYPTKSINSRKKHFSFAHLFNVNGTRAGDCTSDQRFDPTTKTCRNLRCAIPGYVIRNNKCVQL